MEGGILWAAKLRGPLIVIKLNPIIEYGGTGDDFFYSHLSYRKKILFLVASGRCPRCQERLSEQGLLVLERGDEIGLLDRWKEWGYVCIFLGRAGGETSSHSRIHGEKTT